MTTKRVLLVSDPLCSWCWAFTPEYEAAMRVLEKRVAFDLLLGGINLGASLPLGDAAQARFDRLWKQVAETTGQKFSHRLPTAFVYNSTRACIALHAFRSLTGTPPFQFLHVLQERFFAHGEDVTAPGLLADVAVELGVPRAAFTDACADPLIEAKTLEEFAESKRYGTNALPSVLVEDGNGRRLFAGGWMSAAQMTTDVETWLASA
jgi:putative protein-disulfide isomerase